MGTSESGSHDSEERAETDSSIGPQGIKVFEADAWIPVWEQSIPGKRIVLGSVPTSCNLYLEPDPFFAIEISLQDDVALNHHRIMMQQGEQIPMQFEGLEYDNYPIRWNNYVTWTMSKDSMHIRAKCRLMDKGLRTLRMADGPTAEARGFVINLAINNYRPLTLNLNNWVVTLSPQLRGDDDESSFTLTHEIKITNSRGHFSDAELEEFRDALRIVLSVMNIQCCEVVLTQTFDLESSLTGYMIDQLHCDTFHPDFLQYTMGGSQRNEEGSEFASKLYRRIQTSRPQYLEALGMLTCSNYQSIPSLWTILEKTCGSGPSNVRGALQRCVESTDIPSELSFLANELKAGQSADFIEVFYRVRNHFAHEKAKIARGGLIPPETHTIVKRLAQLLCWSKVLTDIDVKCLLWQEARVTFADWDFAEQEGHTTTLDKFQADGTYNALAAIRRLLRAGETPRRTSAYFETPEGKAVFCEATDWPLELPNR